MVLANVAEPFSNVVATQDVGFLVLKKQPMNVWRDERARDIFVGSTTPTEWSTMPLEASSARSRSRQSRPSSFVLADTFQTDRCSRDGYGEWDRPTELSANFPVAYCLHNFSSICLVDAKKEKIRKAKHTPPWDIKEEREHDAANPGPSISEALKQ